MIRKGTEGQVIAFHCISHLIALNGLKILWINLMPNFRNGY